MIIPNYSLKITMSDAEFNDFKIILDIVKNTTGSDLQPYYNKAITKAKSVREKQDDANNYLQKIGCETFVNNFVNTIFSQKCSILNIHPTQTCEEKIKMMLVTAKSIVGDSKNSSISYKPKEFATVLDQTLGPTLPLDICKKTFVNTFHDKCLRPTYDYNQTNPYAHTEFEEDNELFQDWEKYGRKYTNPKYNVIINVGKNNPPLKGLFWFGRHHFNNQYAYGADFPKTT
jgi:hypothetical protein